MGRANFVTVIWLILLIISETTFCIPGQMCSAAGLPDCLESMSKGNLDLSRQLHLIQYYKSGIKAARSAFLPNIEILGFGEQVGGSRRFNAMTEDIYISSLRHHDKIYGYGITGAQPLIKEGSLLGLGAPSIKKERIAVQKEQTVRKELEVLFTNNLTLRFAELEAYRLLHSYWREMNACTAKSLLMVEEEVARGLKNMKDLSVAQERTELVKTQIATFHSKMVSVEQDIKTIAQLKVDEPLETANILKSLDNDIQIAGREQLLTLAINNNLEIAVLKQECDMLKQDFKIIRNAILPEISLSGTYFQLRGFETDVLDDYWKVKMNFKLNIWQSGGLRARIKQIMELLQAKEDEIKLKEKIIRQTVITSLNQIDALLYQRQQGRTLCKIDQQTLDEKTITVNTGLSNESELCETKITWLETLGEFIETKLELKRQLMALLTYLNVKVTDNSCYKFQTN
ncbi:TolC family protein [candidate division CSSED10-310 bacterium]|uniref:TolC family protein n=1 Tax=candidate division CSSED10-310 bacterium TaxID=2855610 RepID=A0ABV6YZ24_UNCC1